MLERLGKFLLSWVRLPKLKYLVLTLPVPGFSGWGTPLFGAVNYWGGIENIPRLLAENGYTVIVTPIAPVSSNWERACELYAQLTSGRYALEMERFSHACF